MVESNLKKLTRGFKARIDEQSFLDLFALRAETASAQLEGSKDLDKITVSRELDWYFLKSPESNTQKEIAKQIHRWWSIEEKKYKTEIEKQGKRISDAEEKLTKKKTKAAENDLRIGTAKLQKAQSALEILRVEPSDNEEFWAFPKYYIPGIIHDQELLVRPFRYLIRPEGQPPSFDDRYNGAYNAQQERLEEVFWWNNLFGKHHGVFLVHRFKERQDEDVAKDRKINLVGRVRKEFEFDPGKAIWVPFIWDTWSDPQKLLPTFSGAAAITCHPPDEVLNKGIGRLLTPIAEDSLNAWLEEKNRSTCKKILSAYKWGTLRCKEVA